MSSISGSADALAADWLGLCRASRDDLRSMLARHPTTVAREEGHGRGAGGDITLVIDRKAEDAVFDHLDAVSKEGHSFTAISEERGAVGFGEGPSEVRVVIDPIDGSLNAKRMIPGFALSIAVAAGDSMEDVEFAYVYDFGVDEEWVAHRREGATLNGLALDPDAPGRGLEVVGFESARPGWIVPVASRLEEDVFRMRVVGSIAITLCYVAAARLDGMLSTNTCRSVDAAAGQLIAREAGAFVTMLGHAGIEGPLDLDTRFRIAAARTPEGLETLVGALTGSGPPPS